MKKILVVEDEHMMREILVDFLKEKGYEVFQASSGSEALVLIDSNNPHLIIQDLALPDMSGLDVMQKAKESNSEAIFLVLTGMEEEELARQAISLGAFDYLVKPVDLEDLNQRFLSQIFS